MARGWNPVGRHLAPDMMTLVMEAAGPVAIEPLFGSMIKAHAAAIDVPPRSKVKRVGELYIRPAREQWPDERYLLLMNISLIGSVNDLPMMKSSNVAPPRGLFFALSAFGFFILLGVMTINGGTKQLLLTMWQRRFSDGSLRHHVYTAIPPVDFIMAMPVSFWIPALTQQPAIKLQSVVLYPALQTLGAWATIESSRSSQNKPLIVRFAPLAVFVWMWLGTGVFMGLWCYFDLIFHFRNMRATQHQTISVPYHSAVSMPLATALVYIWPYLLIHFPPAGMTTAQHQQAIAFNQFGSFACYFLVAGGASYLSSNHTDRKPRHRNADVSWLRGTYALFGAFTFLTHFAATKAILGSGDPRVSFWNVYVPNFAHMLGTEHSKSAMMAPETHFFLQWDFVLFVVFTAIWGAYAIQNMRSRVTEENPLMFRTVLVFLLCVASFLINPGTVLAAILYVREGFLRRSLEHHGVKKH